MDKNRTVSWPKYEMGNFVAWITKTDEDLQKNNILLDKFPIQMEELLDLKPLTDGVKTVFNI